MRRKKHYIIPLFLLLLTLAPTLFMGGLQAFQMYIRQRMERSLAKETLTTITLPANEVVWYEEGREIMVQGQMFDIKSYAVKNGMLTATGMFDEAETEVVNLMKGHWSEQDQQHLLIQLLVLSHLVLGVQLFVFFFKKFILPNSLMLPFLVRYPAPVLPIYVPPPRAIVCFK